MLNESIDTQIIRSLSFDPWYNLALEEHLLHQVNENQIVLYLWQNQNTVVIGRNQNAWKECRWKKLAQDRGKLARRLSGGGAVYHDLGNLNFTFIMDRKLYDLNKQLQVILNTVKCAGIDAVYSGRNDLTVNEKKFSGNAFYFEKDVAYHHGTLLINTDFQKLSQYLQASREKINSKGIDSIRSRVVNLASIDSSVTIEMMINYIKESFIHLYAGACNEIKVDQNMDDMKRLYEKYASWEWRFGLTPQFDISYEKRFSWGDIEIGFCLENGKIESVIVYSDSLNYDIIGKISTSLKNCPFQLEAMIDRIDNLATDFEEEKIICDLKTWLETKSI